jgi:PAS domain S-box-containing protein
MLMHKANILIVEDDGILAACLQEMVTRMNYAVAGPLASGEEAVAFVASKEVDLVLMDIELAGAITGIETAEIICKSLDVPIVFLTGYSQDPLLEQAKIAAPYGYLIKPVPERELAATLAMALHRHDLDHELRQSKRALAESELRYRTLANSGQALIWTSGPDTLCNYFNETWLRFTGRTLEQEMGTGWTEGVHPEDFDRCVHTYLAAFDRREKFSMSYRLRNADGAYRWLQDDGTPRFDSTGAFLGYIGHCLDISDLKQAEAAIKQNEARLESLLRINQHSAAGVQELLDFTLNEAITLTGSTIGYIYFYDATKQEFTLNSWSGAVMRQCAVAEPQAVYHLEKTGLWGEAVRQGRPLVVNDFAAPNPLKKGVPQGHVPLERYLTIPVFNEEQIVAVVAVANKSEDYNDSDTRQLTLMMDAVWKIVQRKQANKALRKSEEQYRRIVQTALEGIWGMDGTMRTTFVNPQLAAMLGYTSEEMLGRPIDEFICQEDLHDHSLQMRQRQQGKNGRYERRLRHKEGRIVWTQVSATSIQDSAGRFAGSFCMFTDITERKRTEEERKRLQGQLQQAQKMEAIGTLAGGIAHDFNNILGAILGYAEMARDDSPSGSAVAGNLDKVLEAGNRAASLVKQILAFSRQSASERIALDPVRIVKEVVKLLRPSLPSTIVIRQQIAATRSILADPTRLHQVLMNLCTNAFHAMEQTGGTLEIAVSCRVLSATDLDRRPGIQPGEFVVLTVSDTGPGISPEIQARIFDPYFTTKEVGQGTGLGLAIVHGIAAEYGGFITCESEPGNGATFRVFLPAVSGEALPNNTTPEPVSTGRERILLVDDEKILVEMGKIMLERLGYEVTVHTDSLEALTAFQNEPDRFDAVVTDQTMPGMTGLDLARRILQIRPGLPVILCTGYSNLVNEVQAKACGIKGFAMKPLTKKEISALLRTVLEPPVPLTAGVGEGAS